MDLNSLSLWTGIIGDVMGAVAILVGGIWVYRNYIQNRMGVWNLKMVITPESIRYNEYSDLMKINVALGNEGNVKITPGSKGCRVTVKRMGKETAKDQTIDLDRGETIVEKDILRKYYHPQIGYKKYEIEPKCEYHELECVVVSKGDLLSIRTEFFWKDDKDSITEYSLFYVE